MTFRLKWRGGGPAQYMIAASSPVLSRSTGPTLVVTFSWICGCALTNLRMRGNSQILPSETGTDRFSRPPAARPDCTSMVASSSSASALRTFLR
ncbi:hypothetical protein D9M69_669940 [compost metagenome]